VSSWRHWRPGKNIPGEDCRVNIRLPKRDVTAIQVKAMEEGIPYQAMMASILHKYVTGRLVEKQS